MSNAQLGVFGLAMLAIGLWLGQNFTQHCTPPQPASAAAATVAPVTGGAEKASMQQRASQRPSRARSEIYYTEHWNKATLPYDKDWQLKCVVYDGPGIPIPINWESTHPAKKEPRPSGTADPATEKLFSPPEPVPPKTSASK